MAVARREDISKDFEALCLKSFSSLDIERDTFKADATPLSSGWRTPPRKDKTMKSVIRKDETAVSPVIATILMVAITVVLAAVLYVMVSGLITPVGANKPLITFTAASLSSGNATISVAGVSQAVSPSSYKVNLQVGTTTGSAIAMPTTGGASVNVVVGATTYRIYWTDIGGERTVNGGDTFRVTGNGVALPAATSFTFFLLWSDGASIQQSAWSTP